MKEIDTYDKNYYNIKKKPTGTQYLFKNDFTTTKRIAFNNCVIPEITRRDFRHFHRRGAEIGEFMDKAYKDLYSLSFSGCIFENNPLSTLNILLKPFRDLQVLNLHNCGLDEDTLETIIVDYCYFEHIIVTNNLRSKPENPNFHQEYVHC